MKTILIFPKNFLNFKLDTIEKQNFTAVAVKGYVTVVLCDSKVAFFRDWDDVAFRPFLSCVSSI